MSATNTNDARRELEQHPLSDERLDGHLNQYAADLKVNDQTQRTPVGEVRNRDPDMRDFW